MQINTTYTQQTPICINKNCSVNTGFFRPNIHFTGIKTDIADLTLYKGLNKLKDFSVEEYKTLTKAELKRLRKEYRKYASFLFHDGIEAKHTQAADAIKTHLDREYGKNNYTVITIGRSLSSIGKVLGYKIGEGNVINIPMSAGKQYLSGRCQQNLGEYGYISKLKDFLAQKGLKKEDIETSGKKYIIMDFCASGKSLEGAKKLLTREDVLGDKNIEKLDVMSCIENKKLYVHLKSDLLNCRYKRYSFVESAYSITDMPEAYVDTQTSNTEKRLTWFKLLDNEMRKT